MLMVSSKFLKPVNLLTAFCRLIELVYLFKSNKGIITIIPINYT